MHSSSPVLVARRRLIRKPARSSEHLIHRISTTLDSFFFFLVFQVLALSFSFRFPSRKIIPRWRNYLVFSSVRFLCCFLF